MRIPQFLSENGVAYEALLYPPAFTAQRRAKRLGVRGEQVVKAVLLSGPEGYLLAILSATCHVNFASLEEALGGPVRLATKDEIRRIFPDCEWGVVQPFGHLYGVSTILDDSIPREASIVFGAHSHAEGVRMTCRDFERIEYPRRLTFAVPGRPSADKSQCQDATIHQDASL
jgi:Ala-tRNA(Pro) deacylase